MLFEKRTMTINPGLIQSIASRHKVSPLLAEILAGRGIVSEDEIQAFLSPSLDQLHDPYLFREMDQCVKAIRRAIEEQTLIAVWGDYDADGVCSASALALELRRLKANVTCYVSDREEDGYGLNERGLEILSDKGVKLIITVDCGIRSADLIRLAKDTYDIDFIVTDHHEPSEDLPKCLAVLNPKVKGETYPYKSLCGAGVAGKVIQALSGVHALHYYLDLIALATIADVVPLTGENRIIAKYGLERLNKSERTGIDALKKAVFKDKQPLINAGTVSYRIAPVLNAPGRLANSMDSIRLLTTTNKKVALEIAVRNFKYNEERRAIEQKILSEALARLGEGPYRAIVISGAGWAKGVVGIVASRLAERYHCPSIVLCFDEAEGVYVGSGRSIPGLNLYDALSSCEGHLEKWGGHEAAAGMTIREDQLADFKEAFEHYLEEMDEALFEDRIVFDAELPIRLISDELLRELSLLEPTGMGNPKPVFIMRDVALEKVTVLGSERSHFRCSIFDGSHRISAIAFGQEPPDVLDRVSLVCHPEHNEYNGSRQLRVGIRRVI